MMFHLAYFLPPANEVWGKVTFLHLSVILFVGGVCIPAYNGAGECLPLGLGDVCLWVQGGVHIPRPDTHTLGRHPQADTPIQPDTPLDTHTHTHTHTHTPGQIPPIEMTIETSGTHPTGIHSCVNKSSLFNQEYTKFRILIQVTQKNPLRSRFGSV